MPRRSLTILPLALLALWMLPVPARSGQDETPAEKEDSPVLDYAGLVALLTGDFPDHIQLALEIGVLRRQISRELQEASPAERISASQVRRELARLLIDRYLSRPVARELSPEDRVRFQLHVSDRLEQAGERLAARDIWSGLANSVRDPELRAECLERLWTYYLFRERYQDARMYGQKILELVPGSPLALRLAPTQAFLELLETGGEFPDFSLTYTHLGKRSLSSFRGKPVLLYFWRSDLPGALDDVQRLRVAIDRAEDEGWKGQVLGFSLDERASTLKEALKTWKVDYRKHRGAPLEQVPVFNFPQSRLDGGFDSPLMRRLGIPRIPMALLLDEEGRLVFANHTRKIPVKKLQREDGKFTETEKLQFEHLGHDYLGKAMRRQIPEN